MTIQKEAMRELNSHWAIQALGEQRIAAAFNAASKLHIEENLGAQLRAPSQHLTETYALVRDVAFAFEVAAGEHIAALTKTNADLDNSIRDTAEAAAHQAFELLRTLPLKVGSLEERVHQVLQLGALAYCSDRWAEFRAWLRERDLGPNWFALPNSEGPKRAAWDSRVLSSIGQVWFRLLRKDGWADLNEVSRTVALLREEQAENEAALLNTQERPEHARAAGWRLVALYHWAKISEIVATYLMQGEPQGIAEELDFHFDRAMSAAQQAGDPAFVVVLQWQWAMTKKMTAGSLWAIARIGPEIRKVVQTATRHRSMFEMLPPQKVAIQEQGLLDPASAAVVVDLPTSAGKTLLAEFKIVQAISQFRQDNGWVAYVAPTRALVSQITRRLRRDLGPGGIRVEELTAAVEIDDIEASMLNESSFDVLVATPEKLHLAIRNAAVQRPLALLVMDEAHNIEDPSRGIRIELLLATVKRDCPEANFLLLMPHVPNGAELARWLEPESGKSISLNTTPWQPNDRLIGLVSADPPPSGRGRDWQLSFEPMVTSGSSIKVDAQYKIGDSPQLDRTYSDIKVSLSGIAAAASLTLSERGTSIVVCRTIPSAWSVAGELATRLPDCRDNLDPEIVLVQKFLASEISPDYSLINLLSRRVAVHHAGLSDETRSLIEWLAETGKIRILVSTSGLSQGLNFPVSSILLASTSVPGEGFSRDMTAREFWNMAGRAGRVDHDSIGFIGISCKVGARASLVEFLAETTGNLVSQLVVLLNDLEENGRLLNLERSIYGDQWSDFRSYVAHLYAQKKNLDAVLAETELLLRNTFGYTSLSNSGPAQRQQGRRLLEATRSYAAELADHAETATLADSTGFTPEGIRSALAGMRSLDRKLDLEDWKPDRLFGESSSSALPDLMRVMLQLPQIKDNIEELVGTGTGIGDRASKVAADWVNGASVRAIAMKYFSSKGDLTASLTEATKAIYRNLAYAGTWGLSTLSKLPTSGINYDNLEESELRSVNLLGAMLYHGVNTEAGVVMRMSSVPRSAATSLGNAFAQYRGAEPLRPSDARDFLSKLSTNEWSHHIPGGSQLDGSDMRSIWQVLSGTTAT